MVAGNGPVLIVSTLAEPSVDRVIQHLDRMAVPWCRLNCEDFPLLRTVIASIGDSGATARLTDGDRSIALEEVRSRWFRRMSPPVLPARLSPHDRQFAEGEVAALLLGTVFGERGFAVNPRDAERRATNKLNQLRAAAALGLAVPETIVTNDPAAARQFADAVDGRVIFKPVSGFAPRAPDLAQQAADRFAQWGPVANTHLETRDYSEAIFAQLLDGEKLAELDAIRLAPVTFQRFIPKTADIRVTVVGRDVFACRIRSQVIPETRIDFRRMATTGRAADVPHETCALPTAIESAVHALMDELGLVFGCLDFVEEADGGMTFLEVNPTGQWLWIEQRTGQAITERLAAMLAAGRV